MNGESDNSPKFWEVIDNSQESNTENVLSQERKSHVEAEKDAV